MMHEIGMTFGWLLSLIPATSLAFFSASRWPFDYSCFNPG